jgi:hypothetical protein
MKEKIFGFTPSIIDGTEKIFESNVKVELPQKYTYEPYLPDVLNQGEESICVPCTISAYLNWKENLKTGENIDNGISLYEIYDSKSNKNEGMTYKDAFKFLRHVGVTSKKGNLKINAYGMILNLTSLKHALITNGPCCGALPVYSDDYEFWNQRYGEILLGYHAISIVGYDEKGFYIRNSWGRGFGKNGYTYIKNKDMNKMVEIWTIID